MTELMVTVLSASAAAFGLALLSAVAGFGGGVLLLPVFTVLFGLRAAVPMLTLTQLSSNGSRVWLNRRDLRWPLIGWFALGAGPAHCCDPRSGPPGGHRRMFRRGGGSASP
jgi:uncharacterized membrane protein YfcA